MAENQGTGSLADGFTGLGNRDGTLNYAFDLILDAQTPEPGTFAPGLIAIAGLVFLRFRRP